MIVKTKSNSIVTYTGKRVWPFDLKPKDIDPLDIAAALSNICRYNGHVSGFISVAQHSCLVHDYAPKELKKQALLHDATEAYCGDMVAPLKHLDSLAEYREIEDNIWVVVAERFNLPQQLDEQVKELDVAIRSAEIRDLKNGIGSLNTSANEKIADRFAMVDPWSPKKAKKQMITRMQKLGIEVSDE